MWNWANITVRMMPKPIGSAAKPQPQGVLTKKPAETPSHAPKPDDVK